tara:strand:- start:107 stop:463 length:357 start_codon:yes stop_codon:yes gene_type:complete
MKKITISIALLASVLALKAQDTSCTYFKGKTVYEFDYHADTILSSNVSNTKYYNIDLKYGDVLCLDLSDEKNRVRKVITTFFDGETITQTLNSKNNVYFSPQGTTRVSVGKPKIAIKL